jgi:hypothetical protein
MYYARCEQAAKRRGAAGTVLNADPLQVIEYTYKM